MPKVVPRMTPEAITDMARKCVTGQGFVANEPEAVRSAFMMSMLFDWSDTNKDDVGAFYGDMKDSAPMGCNGYPVFLAFTVVHTEDVPLVRAEIERMEAALGVKKEGQ